MKSKRVIVSLREDELQIIQIALKDCLNNLPETSAQPLNTTQGQAIVILKGNIIKLIKKLEDKNGK